MRSPRALVSFVGAGELRWVILLGMASDLFTSADPSIYEIRTRAPGPQGSLPLTEQMLRSRPSGDIFGWTQNAGMGWDPKSLGGKEVLILSTQGGIRAPDGRPIALGYHTGHYEVGLLMEEAARRVRSLGGIPFAGFCTDPCDGRSQGTSGMMDSLPYRNDAAQVFRRLIRSLPTRSGVIGVATCDKGLPAMMMALASMHELPTVLVPGGVTLPASDGEDAGKVQSIGVRFSRGELSLPEASDLGCRACGSPGAVASSSVPPRRRRSSARRWGCRCHTRRWLRRASRFGSRRPRAQPTR